MKRWGFSLAALFASASSFAACSLEDGATFDVLGDAAVADGSQGDASDAGTTDGNAPDVSVSDAARALTFCDFQDASAAFFFCNDFDRDAAPLGEVAVVTADASIAFVESDASAPHAFESSVASLVTDKSDVNGATLDSFQFADASAGFGFTHVTIAFDLRVNALTFGAPGNPAPFVNTALLALGEKFAFTAPIVDTAGKPTFSFDAVDLADGGNTATLLGDGGITVGSWTHVSFDLAIDPDLNGIATLTRDGVTAPPFAFRLSNDAHVAPRWRLLLGMSANGPVSAAYDVDNVVVTSDKR